MKAISQLIANSAKSISKDPQLVRNELIPAVNKAGFLWKSRVSEYSVCSPTFSLNNARCKLEVTPEQTLRFYATSTSPGAGPRMGELCIAGLSDGHGRGEPRGGSWGWTVGLEMGVGEAPDE